MTKLKYLRVANAVKCGPNEHTYFDSKSFEMTMVDAIRVLVVHKQTQQRGFTSLFNAISWDELEGPKSAGSAKEPEGDEGAEGAPAPKRKRVGGEG